MQNVSQRSASFFEVNNMNVVWHRRLGVPISHDYKRDRKMPLARIEIPLGKSAEFKQIIGSVVYQALVEVLGAPKDDRFQIISEHSSDCLIMDPTYLAIERSSDALIIQITLNEGRTTDLKKAFYHRVADELHNRAGIRKEDVFINLIEVKRDNWSFGNGIAQYA